MTWEEWVGHHITLFGLSKADQLATVAKWWRLFEGGGFSPREMAADSDWVALHDPPRILDGHMRGLLEYARQQRARAAARPTEADFTACFDCGGSGWVVVPSWKPFQGRWGTAGCACTCSAGSRNREANRERMGGPTPIEVYEATNPGWREQLKAQERQQGEELRALNEAGGIACEIGKVVVRAKRASG